MHLKRLDTCCVINTEGKSRDSSFFSLEVADRATALFSADTSREDAHTVDCCAGLAYVLPHSVYSKVTHAVIVGIHAKSFLG